MRGPKGGELPREGDQVIDEKRVQMAHRMYECRTTAKMLLGDQYQEKLAPYRKVVRAVADRDHRGNELPAVTAIVKKAVADGKGDDITAALTLYVTAAAVEEIEAREAVERAKSPQQRADELLRAVLGDDWKGGASVRRRRARAR